MKLTPARTALAALTVAGALLITGCSAAVTETEVASDKTSAPTADAGAVETPDEPDTAGLDISELEAGTELTDEQFLAVFDRADEGFGQYGIGDGATTILTRTGHPYPQVAVDQETRFLNKLEVPANHPDFGVIYAQGALSEFTVQAQGRTGRSVTIVLPAPDGAGWWVHNYPDGPTDAVGTMAVLTTPDKDSAVKTAEETRAAAADPHQWVILVRD